MSLAESNRRGKADQYAITIRGVVPVDIKIKISAAQAEALKRPRRRTISDPVPDPKASQPMPIDEIEW